MPSPSAPPAAETFVLIAGGGPVGLSAAIELGWRRVPAILINERLETAQHPKCNTTNARSMELYRRLGIAGELRAAAIPLTVARASAYVTRFCGHELGRIPRPHSDWPTPELPAYISQIVLERELLRIAREQAATALHFGWKLVSFTEEGEGIVAEVESVTGEKRSIRARHLIGADGAASTVRKQIGAEMVGEDGTAQRAFMGGTMLSYYIRSPGLMAESGREPTHATWIINPKMRGLMFTQDGRERWVTHYQVPPGVDWRALDARQVVREMIGGNSDFEILSGGPWTGGFALVADKYQGQRASLAGDAAHLFTPLGGMGMNTGLGDIANLCWKLAALHQGWGGARLLESYWSERHAIGARNSQFGVQCSRIMDGWQVPANIEEDNATAQAARQSLGAQVVEEDAFQYRTAGLQLGERYEDSPLICAEAGEAPQDRWDVCTPTGRPGGRAPHYWVKPGQSVHDLFGPGYTLLADAAQDAGASTDAFASAAAARGVPLANARIEATGGDTALDQAGRAAYGAPLVLVRPDHHIVWRGSAATLDEAAAILDRARGA